MVVRTREVRLRADPVLVELAARCNMRLVDVLEHGIMNRLGITRRQLVDIRHENKFTGRPTHSQKHARRMTIYSGIDGREYCLD